jgi:hypothetical protein
MLSLFSRSNHRLYRWRKWVAAVLSVRYGLGPGGLALLLEDDRECSRYVQRFLIEHQVSCPMPFYNAQGKYLFHSPGKIDVLAKALTDAVLHGRDNELFVLLVDFLEAGPHLEKILRAVRVALGRHHQVVVVCPWPANVDLPRGRHTAKQDYQADLQAMLNHASALRIQQAFGQVRQAFAKLGVRVLCAPEEEAVAIVLERMRQLRTFQRGRR